MARATRIHHLQRPLGVHAAALPAGQPSRHRLPGGDPPGAAHGRLAGDHHSARREAGWAGGRCPSPRPAPTRLAAGAIISGHLRAFTSPSAVNRCGATSPYSPRTTWTSSPRYFPDARYVCLHRHAMDMIASGLEACRWGLPPLRVRRVHPALNRQLRRCAGPVLAGAHRHDRLLRAVGACAGLPGFATSTWSVTRKVLSPACLDFPAGGTEAVRSSAG